jgi:hypothetical protein
MILFWLLWVSLVLGGVAGFLAARARRDGLGSWLVRVPAPVRRIERDRDGAGARRRAGQGEFLPVPGVTTHPGSPPGRLT